MNRFILNETSYHGAGAIAAIVDEAKISAAVTELVDLRPAAIIRDFDLRKPIYCQLAAYGHMGREDIDVAWEKRDLAEKLRAKCL